MAKGSVRKKGKKWYYRFYVEDASGNSVQREFPGSESKSETEAMLRKAMADYEEKQFVAKSENLTLAGLLDKWIEEELKPGSLSNGTVAAYIDTARRIKKHPIADRKLKKITPDHLQSYYSKQRDIPLPCRPAGQAGTAQSTRQLSYQGALLRSVQTVLRLPRRRVPSAKAGEHQRQASGELCVVLTGYWQVRQHRKNRPRRYPLLPR